MQTPSFYFLNFRLGFLFFFSEREVQRFFNLLVPLLYEPGGRSSLQALQVSDRSQVLGAVATAFQGVHWQQQEPGRS